MYCPACRKHSLHRTESEDAPQRLACGECGGQWVKSFQYWKWLKAHGENLPERPPEEGARLPVEDSGPPKLCPECGHFLTRSRVGHGVEFHLDRCGVCGGLWFDRNEWEVLKSRNLHDDVHFIFSAAWQHRIAEEEYRQAYEKRVRDTLGSGDFERVRAFKAWARAHPRRNTIMAFLADLDV